MKTNLKALLYFIVLSPCLLLQAQLDTKAAISQLFNEEEFVNRFLGSYGFLSGAEPKINEDEIELFRDVLELIQVNPKAAAARLSQEVKDSSSAALSFTLGNLYFQAGQTDKAQQSYSTAIKKFPDYRRAYKNLGLLMVQNGQLKEGAANLSRAIELGDRDGRNYGLLGYCYLDQDHFIAAEEAYNQAILQQPDKKDWKVGLAQTLLSQERYAEADAMFSTLLKDDPTNVDYWLLQANTYLGRDEPLRAAINLEVVKELGKAKTESLVLLGDIYMNANMPDVAIEAYLAVVERDSSAKGLKAALRASGLLVQFGSYANAKELIGSVRTKYNQVSNEDDLQLLNLEAKIARFEGNAVAAAETLETIIKRDPLNGEALLELAKYYAENKQEEKAIFKLDQAKNIKGFEFKALVQHAQLLVSQKEYKEAASLLREALSIKPDDRIQRYLSRVEEAARVS